MITVKKSPMADTRTCDWSKATKDDLLKNSQQHIKDVQQAICFFINGLAQAGHVHDHTKLSGIDGFHKDFSCGFKTTDWWDNHRKTERHHLEKEDGIRDDVNLIDVIEFVCDCVMAGRARSGKVRELIISDETLRKAFTNTWQLLDSEVSVKD